jgi:hypothetical protein
METATTTTIEKFIEKHGLTARADPAECNPNCPGWANARHWLVTFRKQGNPDSFTVPFSQGLGHTESPTAVDVLGCLMSDCISYECSEADFGAWADEWDSGEKPSSLWRTFNNIRRQVVALESFLGFDAYRDLTNGSVESP